jgi:hypothetical protein
MHIKGRAEVTVGEILRDALHLEIGRCGQNEQNRVARCLLSLKWERKQVRTGVNRAWKYRRPVTNDEDGGLGVEQTGNVTAFKR